MIARGMMGLIVLCVRLLPPPAASASLIPDAGTTILVNTLTDEVKPDGDWGLREAIRAANLDRRWMRPRPATAGTGYRAARRSHLHPDHAGADDTAILGDLDITDDLHPHQQQRDYRRQRCNHAGPGHPGVSRQHRHDLERHASQRADHLVWRRHPQRGQPDAAHGNFQRQSKHHQRRRRHRKRT